METTHFPPSSGASDPITDRSLSGISSLVAGIRSALAVLVLVGPLVGLQACAASGSEDPDQARRDQIRREAPAVFADHGSFDRTDRARVFEDPGDPDALPMTRTLSIDGNQPTRAEDRQPAQPRPRPSAAADTGGWAILLERVSGPEHQSRANGRAATLARALGRSDVRVRAVSSGSAVVMGGYAGPDDQRAQEDLRYVKSLSVQGSRPYAMAILVPPPVEDGSNPRHSLVEAAKSLERIYTHTLQVAVFAGDESQRRAEAERYCAQLRNQGQEAYYFHGRRVSSVTIGAFTARDFDLSTGQVSPRLERLQERFPHNLYNGEVQRDPTTGDTWNSALVEIPRTG